MGGARPGNVPGPLTLRLRAREGEEAQGDAVAATDIVMPALQSMPLLAMAWSGFISFAVFWFGAMRFEHAGSDDFEERLRELFEAHEAVTCPVRKEKLHNKLQELKKRSEAVKLATGKGAGGPMRLRDNFKRVKRPKRNQAAVYPDAPKSKPTLRITVVAAKGLKRTDRSVWGALPPDPYFTCQLVGDKNRQYYDGKDDVADKTCDPVFNVTFEFQEVSPSAALEFRLYDQDIGRDDLLGVLRLDAVEFADGLNRDDLQLTQCGPNAGTLHVRIEVLLPKARGWGGPPVKPRDRATAWTAGEFEEEQQDEQVVGQTPPVFVILQCAAAFLLWVFGQGREADPMSGLESFAYGQTSLLLQKDCSEDFRYHAWRWLSYQFTHVGISHIGFNCLMVILMGIPLEGFNGTFVTFLMFNVGVFGGACCWMVSDVHTETVGMSGGCYSLIGMMLGDLVMNWADTKNARTVLMMILIIPAVDLTQAYFASHDNVSNSAHFGGTIAGLIAGIILGRNIHVSAFERKLQVVTVVVGALLAAFCLFWALQDPVPMDIWEQVRFCWHRQVVSLNLFNDTAPHCVRCDNQDCVQRWVTAIDACGADCVIGIVGFSTCGSYGGWSDVQPAAPSTTTPIPLLNSSVVASLSP
eukprot:CAMPEP_0170237472 /NCGR_PEP_ID=MMETSP0116_2-20130129/18486_1 /TAXON_ID=400756 /ORGANISM="Durinskia baltica, Strain CSIRO CS-38" /LENGTH=637 /DNA_ID=CAMNT_0010488275 /DNA_START=1 /DNA_END=1915 /DNA_ORIENTATION=-